MDLIGRKLLYVRSTDRPSLSLDPHARLCLSAMLPPGSCPVHCELFASPAAFFEFSGLSLVFKDDSLCFVIVWEYLIK